VPQFAAGSVGHFGTAGIVDLSETERVLCISDRLRSASVAGAIVVMKGRPGWQDDHLWLPPRAGVTFSDSKKRSDQCR
jgi:hypothetical protein